MTANHDSRTYASGSNWIEPISPCTEINEEERGELYGKASEVRSTRSSPIPVRYFIHGDLTSEGTVYDAANDAFVAPQALTIDARGRPGAGVGDHAGSAGARPGGRFFRPDNPPNLFATFTRPEIP
jgi:hypothetical protein